MNRDIKQNNISKVQKIVKYILMGLVIYIALIYIPEIPIKKKEVIMISATSSITFAILDMLSPTIKLTIIESENNIKN